MWAQWCGETKLEGEGKAHPIADRPLSTRARDVPETPSPPGVLPGGGKEMLLWPAS